MTLQNVIDAYREINPGDPRSNINLTQKVTDFDRNVQENMLHTFPYEASQDPDTGKITKAAGTLVSYGYPEDIENPEEPDDRDTELLLSGTPYEDLYVLYISAIVSFEQEDWMKYQNKKAMYNARYIEALNYFTRNNMRIQENSLHNLW